MVPMTLSSASQSQSKQAMMKCLIKRPFQKGSDLIAPAPPICFWSSLCSGSLLCCFPNLISQKKRKKKNMPRLNLPFLTIWHFIRFLFSVATFDLASCNRSPAIAASDQLSLSFINSHFVNPSLSLYIPSLTIIIFFKHIFHFTLRLKK